MAMLLAGAAAGLLAASGTAKERHVTTFVSAPPAANDDGEREAAARRLAEPHGRRRARGAIRSTARAAEREAVTTEPFDEAAAEREIAAAQRDAWDEAQAEYLEALVAPRLADCWKGLEGDGEIEFRHSFRVVDGVAFPAPLLDGEDEAIAIVEASLSPEEQHRALDCMRAAVDGTSFEYVPRDADDRQDGLAVYQVWPSPARVRRLAARSEDPGG
jgi:hypothetical protein